MIHDFSGEEFKDDIYDLAYQQGREDAIEEIRDFRNSLDILSEARLIFACDIILELLNEEQND